MKDWTIKKNINYAEIIKCLIALSIIAFVTVTMLILTCYSAAACDDYAMYNLFGGYDGSNALSYASELTELIYNTHNGWFGAAFIFYWAPLVFAAEDIVLLKYVSFAIISLFFLAMLFMIRAIMKNTLKDSKWSSSLFLYAAMLVIVTQFLDPSNFFYWYTALAMYGIPALFLFLTFGLITYLVENHIKKPIRILFIIVSVVSCCIIGGSTLMYPIFLGLVLLTIYIYMQVKKKPYRMLILTLIAILGIAFIINIMAKGNYARLDKEFIRLGSFSTETAIFDTFGFLFGTFLHMISQMPLISIFIAITPIFASITRNIDFSFDRPVRTCIIAFLLLILVVFPVAFIFPGLEPANSGRFSTSLTIFLFIDLTFILVYIIGWLVKKHNFKVDSINAKVSLIVMATIAFAFSLQVYPLEKWLSSDIIINLQNNYIQETNDDYLRLVNEIKNSTDSDVKVDEVENYYDKLYGQTLYLTEDKENWFNIIVADYFNKNSVVINPKNE